MANPDAYQKTRDQSESILMSKFPLELRWKLYEHALGNETLHIYAKQYEPITSLITVKCSHIPCRRPFAVDEHARRRTKSALALLRTCRIVYVCQNYLGKPLPGLILRHPKI